MVDIITDLGEGIGGEYEGATAIIEDGQPGRKEKVIIRIVGDKRVTVKLRERVAPVDPLILLTKAGIYTKQVPGSRYPTPPINRRVKEALIKVSR